MMHITPDSTLGSTLQAATTQWGQATAYIDPTGSHTFQTMDERSDRLAQGLLGLGLQRGDRVGVLALNQIEWLLVFYAAAKIGVAVVGLSVRYRDTELQYMLADSGAKALFTVSAHEGFDFSTMMDRLAPQLPQLRHVVLLDEGGPATALRLSSLAATPPRAAALPAAAMQVRSSDLAMVIYTSGTTGKPKGAGLTHGSLLASAAAEARHIRARPGDLVQVALPLNHVGGITCCILTQLCGGGACELVPMFKAELMIERMRRHPPTIVTGVPTMLTLLLMHPASAELDLSGVRLIITGGSNVEEVLLRQLRQRMPRAAIMNLYGLSESSGAIVMTPWTCTEDELMGSIGQAFPEAELRIVADDGRAAPEGEVGELWFRGAGVVPGYIGEAAGSGAFDAQGWLHTGDLGCRDARGFIRLKGRKKDMYIQGGFNVYPAEIENFISQYPGVMMVAGIGVPDPVLGEVGRYYVVPQPGSELSVDALREHCRAHLADYKVPRQFVLRQDLPLTPAGKIQKAVLRDECR